MAWWVIPAVIAGAQVYGGYKEGDAARRAGAEQRNYYDGLANQLAGQRPGAFIAPFIPNNFYKQHAAAIEAWGEWQGRAAIARGENIQIQHIARAKQFQAISQREAIEERRTGREEWGDAVASVTSSGGVTGDIDATLADISATAEYNALSRLWEGNQAATDERYAGDMVMYEAKLERSAHLYNARMDSAKIQADGMYQNALGKRQNAIAKAEYDQYLIDRTNQINTWRQQGDMAYREGKRGQDAAISNGWISGATTFGGAWMMNRTPTTTNVTTLTPTTRPGAAFAAPAPYPGEGRRYQIWLEETQKRARASNRPMSTIATQKNRWGNARLPSRMR